MAREPPIGKPIRAAFSFRVFGILLSACFGSGAVPKTAARGFDSFRRCRFSLRSSRPQTERATRVRPRGSVDRAAASEAAGRRFDSCRGHRKDGNGRDVGHDILPFLVFTVAPFESPVSVERQDGRFVSSLACRRDGRPEQGDPCTSPGWCSCSSGVRAGGLRTVAGRRPPVAPPRGPPRRQGVKQVGVGRLLDLLFGFGELSFELNFAFVKSVAFVVDFVDEVLGRPVEQSQAADEVLDHARGVVGSGPAWSPTCARSAAAADTRTARPGPPPSTPR